MLSVWGLEITASSTYQSLVLNGAASLPPVSKEPASLLFFHRHLFYPVDVSYFINNLKSLNKQYISVFIVCRCSLLRMDLVFSKKYWSCLHNKISLLQWFPVILSAPVGAPACDYLGQTIIYRVPRLLGWVWPPAPRNSDAMVDTTK